MSFNSYMVSAELTIDLDEDFQPEINENVATPVESQKNNRHTKFQPIAVKDVNITVSDSYKISHLTDEARMLLEEHLDVIQVGTMQNWQNIANLMGASGDVIMNLGIITRPTLTLLERFGSKKVNDLLSALESAYRIDTLFSLKLLQEENDLLREVNFMKSPPKFEKPSTSENASISFISDSIMDSATYSNAPTAPPQSISSSTLNSKTENEVLVVHYEVSKEEKRQFKWLMKNLKQANSNAHFPKRLIKVKEIVSDENVGESIEAGFRRAESIIFCFSPSLLALIDGVAQDIEGNYTKILLNLAVTEYFRNSSQNKRFRPVFYEELSSEIPSVGWIASTFHYFFPAQFPELAERIFKMG